MISRAMAITREFSSAGMPMTEKSLVRLTFIPWKHPQSKVKQELSLETGHSKTSWLLKSPFGQVSAGS